MPGVRVNFTKNGIGLGFGGHGARFSVHSTGRRTVSFGIPGTGLYWTETRKTTTTPRQSSGPTRRRSPEPDSPRGSGQQTRPAGPQAATPPPPPHEATALRSITQAADALAGQPDTRGIAFALQELGAALGHANTSAIPASAVDASPLQGALTGMPADRVLADPQSAGLTLQPLPGVEIHLPLTPDALRLFCCLHLLAAGATTAAEELLHDTHSSDEAMLMRAVLLLHRDQPYQILALGPVTADSAPAWLTGLIRAEALRLSCRFDEARNLLDDLRNAAAALEPPPDTDALDILAVNLARLHIDTGSLHEACDELTRVLADDPYDTDARDLLERVRSLMVDSASTTLDRIDHDVLTKQARRIMASLHAELLGARLDLTKLEEELEDLLDERDRRLGPAQIRLAHLKARLAAAIARETGDPADRERADEADADYRHQRDHHEEQTLNDDETEDHKDEHDRHTDDDATGTRPPPSPELKRIYRKLMRLWHPDNSRHAGDIDYRTHKAAEITRLYEARDVDGLRDLLNYGTPDNRTQPTTNPKEPDPLHRQIEDLRRELATVRQTIRKLLTSSLESLYQEREQATRQGRDLFAEMLNLMEYEIADLTTALENFEQSQSTHQQHPHDQERP